MGKVGFSDLKLKLIGAISAVEPLKVCIDSAQSCNTQLAWEVGIHLTFVFSGAMFALTERVAERKGGH